MITITFTGHRPDKLPGKFNIYSDRNRALAKAMYDVIINIIGNNKGMLDDHIIRFISGGALGVDTIAFMVAENVKAIAKHTKIENIIAAPFEQQDCKWPEPSRIFYRNMLELADKVIYVDTISHYNKNKLYHDNGSLVPTGEYHYAKMYNRNMYMVDNSDFLIAVFDGSIGGTMHCVNYAKEMDRNIYYIDPNEV